MFQYERGGFELVKTYMLTLIYLASHLLKDRFIGFLLFTLAVVLSNLIQFYHLGLWQRNLILVFIKRTRENKNQRLAMLK